MSSLFSRKSDRGDAMNYEELYRRSIHDRDGFWGEQAKRIDWHRPFDTVCDYSEPPFARWFAGG